MERIACFVDGQSLYGACTACGQAVDFKKFRAWLGGTAAEGVTPHDTSWRLARAAYYSRAVPAADDNDYVSVKPLLDWLEYNGWGIVTRRSNGAVAVELATDAMALAHTRRIDTIVLASGSPDYVPMIRHVQKLAVRVVVLSMLPDQAIASFPGASDDLRRAADEFVNLPAIIGMVGRPTRPASERTARELRRREVPA